ncbi:hypothetical protein ROSA5918_07885 [Roseateles saccharophilus]|uniref:Uncharacterized protein n=1 Tax=Roseateles saccharophilus TaxID=304 RepID=A0A4R3UXG4_ROSSA|nr:hypothetical protein EV671_101686 [Roseateles saccharophilus]
MKARVSHRKSDRNELPMLQDKSSFPRLFKTLHQLL